MHMQMTARLARAIAFTICVALTASASAQTAAAPPTWRDEMKAGLAAAKAKDYPAYLAHMEKALELNTRALNRPELMYHAARAAALGGKPSEAVAWLDRLWEDKVESLMISYASIDPAFEEARKLAAWTKLQEKVRRLEVTTVDLAPGIVLLDGAGCALVASIGEDGVLLVDTGYAPASSAIAAALRARGESKPLKFVVNTHHHEDHVAGNVAFSRATIIAHPKTREEMAKEQKFLDEFPVPAKPARALPQLLVEGPTTIHFNGDQVLLVPFPAHSSSDIAVVFRKANVVHMGDNYFPGAQTLIYPGDNVEGFVSAMRIVMRDLPDDARVVSGHAPVVPGSELKKIWGATEKLYELVRAGIDGGDSLEAIKEEGAAAGYRADWIEHFYGALKK